VDGDGRVLFMHAHHTCVFHLGEPRYIVGLVESGEQDEVRSWISEKGSALSAVGDRCNDSHKYLDVLDDYARSICDCSYDSSSSSADDSVGSSEEIYARISVTKLMPIRSASDSFFMEFGPLSVDGGLRSRLEQPDLFYNWLGKQLPKVKMPCDCSYGHMRMRDPRNEQWRNTFLSVSFPDSGTMGSQRSEDLEQLLGTMGSQGSEDLEQFLDQLQYAATVVATLNGRTRKSRRGGATTTRTASRNATSSGTPAKSHTAKLANRRGGGAVEATTFGQIQRPSSTCVL